MPKKRKTFRNPNGYGTVVYLGKGRRRPWAAKITIGMELAPRTKQGFRQVRKVIGYAESKKEALEILSEYNKNRAFYDHQNELSKLTFKDIYDNWSTDKYKNISKSTIAQYTWAYNQSSSLHELSFASIKLKHLQDIINALTLKKESLEKITSLWHGMYEYAMIHEIVEKDYSTLVRINVKTEKSELHKAFTNEEIQRLTENVDKIPYADTVLIMIYSGLRPTELLTLKTKDINLEDHYMIGGIKTDAGKNRVIPIHPKIYSLIKKRCETGYEYLVTKDDGTKISYQYYKDKKFGTVMRLLNMEHLPHDGRHTFATLMSNSNANPTAIKKMIGHKSFKMTEDTYIHKNLDDLKDAIEKI